MSRLQSLFRQISELRKENADTRKFVPKNQLRLVIKHDIITEIVQNFTALDRVKEVADFIVQDAPTIFAILVLMSHVRSIDKFIRTDQLQTRHVDDRLPLSRDVLKTILDDDLHAELFHEKQWEFCAPVFSDRIIPRIFERQTILPYLSDDFVSSGAFGSVHKIVIHPLHRPNGYESVAEYVRKELEFDDSTYENEIQVLSTLQRLDHPNILKILACYTLGTKHNIVSPFVRHGTLKDFLKRETPKPFRRTDLFPMISGLASAIWALHVIVLDDTKPSRKGHHQDLRQENVLFDGEKFILADFGLSSVKSMSQNTTTPFKGRKGYYQAPECVDLGYPYQEHHATPADDIWALGCILSELVVYLEQGQSGVKDFRDNRNFGIGQVSYYLFHKGDKSNEAVALVLNEISASVSSRSVDMIVKLIAEMLHLSPLKRPAAGEVTAKLYLATVEAFRERLCLLYTRFGDSPDAIVEHVRFESWVSSIDVHYLQTRSGPTNTQRMFESIVRILTSMIEVLTSIEPTRTLDCRDFIEIRHLNTELMNMLSQEKAATARTQFKSILMANITPKPTDAVYKALMTVFGDSKITEMAEIKQMVAQVDHGLVETMKLPFAKIIGPIETVRTTGNHKIAKVNTGRARGIRTMVVESIYYQDQYRRDKLVPRIIALCDLLSSSTTRSELKILKLYGVHDNYSTFSFELLYEYPGIQSGLPSSISPITLLDLLADRDRSKYPAMETRLQLALDLAEALAAFHKVSWYHKDLTSRNIFFFTGDTEPSMRASNPYVLGFQHSRSANDDFTEGPLQDRGHQRYHDPRYISAENRQFRDFQPQFDHYSLGIVLCEIGFWSPITRIMSEHSKADNTAFSKILCTQKLPELEFGMGRRYVDLVTRCLIDVGRAETRVASPSNLKLSLTSTFEQDVILPLKSLVFLQGSIESPRKRKHEVDVNTAEFSRTGKRQRPA